MTDPPDKTFFAQVTDQDGARLLINPFAPDHPSYPSPDGLQLGSLLQVRADPSGVTDYELLALPGSALWDIVDLAASHGLDPFLPTEVELEASRILSSPGLDDPSLIDRRDLPFCTIDYVTSKDLDQALYVEPDGEGFTVWYAIADAAFYVRPGSPIWNEALSRGSTYYLPGLTVPMLPLRFCEGIVSLNPQVDRRALLFRMTVAPDGTCSNTDIERALIRSRAKLDYDGVQRFYDGAELPADDEVKASLRLLRSVGELRLSEAAGRNVVRFHRADVDVRIEGRPGLRFSAVTDLRTDCERYSEQISLMANIEGALWLNQGDAPDDHVHPIFRVHNPPGPQRLHGLERQIRGLVRAHGLPEDGWLWRADGPVSLANYLRNLPADPEHRGIVRAIRRQAMMSTGRAGFTTEAGRHHGVGADAYARFTAPMREIVGIFLHRESWQKQAGAEDPAIDDEALRERVIEAAGRSKSLQRKLTNLANRMVLDQIFGDDLEAASAPARPGTVMGISRGKLHVQLDNPAIDVKLYRRDVEQAAGRDLKASRDQSCLLSDDEVWLRVGDRVSVQVFGRDEERDRWQLGVVNSQAASRDS